MTAKLSPPWLDLTVPLKGSPNPSTSKRSHRLLVRRDLLIRYVYPGRLEELLCVGGWKAKLAQDTPR